MAKRIKIYFPDGKDQIEIPDDKLEKYLANGFKIDKKVSRSTTKKVEVEEETKETNEE
jgi:ribosomal protein S16